MSVCRGRVQRLLGKEKLGRAQLGDLCGNRWLGMAWRKAFERMKRHLAGSVWGPEGQGEWMGRGGRELQV